MTIINIVQGVFLLDPPKISTCYPTGTLKTSLPCSRTRKRKKIFLGAQLFGSSTFNGKSPNTSTNISVSEITGYSFVKNLVLLLRFRPGGILGQSGGVSGAVQGGSGGVQGGRGGGPAIGRGGGPPGWLWH